jgi:hypothetical protein
MIAIDSLDEVVFQTREIVAQGILKQRNDGFMDNALVALKSQHIVGVLTNDLGSDGDLCSDRIDRYDTTRQFENTQQFRNGRDLIGLIIDLHLTQNQAVGYGPGANHVNGILAVGMIVRPSQFFAIESDHLSMGDLENGSDPGKKVNYHRLKPVA